MSAPVLFPSLRGYRREFLTSDLVAGLTLWAVVVPEALAYATIAGVSPVVGLYAVAPAAVLYAVFGTSRHLVVGPMSATAALSAAAVVPLAQGDDARAAVLTAALAIVTGVLALAAGLLRLGFVAGFISEPVLKGFIVGMALTIIVGQVPKLFGVKKSEGNFFEQAAGFLTHLGSTKPAALVMGAACLALLVLLRRLVPRLPASLVVVLLAIATVHLFHLSQDAVPQVGTISTDSFAVGLPTLQLQDYLQLLGSAGGIALVGFAEGLGAAKEYAARTGYAIDPNRELVGLGAANLGSGLASGMVVNGSLSKTAVNGQAGARTQISGLTAGAVTVLTVLFLTGLFEALPESTLAAVVIVAVVELVDLRSLEAYYRLWTSRLGSIYGRWARADFIGAVSALAGVLVLDTLPGLVVGVLVSLFLLVYRSSKPHVAVMGRKDGQWVDVSRVPGAQQVEGVAVVRVESALFFANADWVRERLVADLGPRDTGLVLDAGTVPMVDLTAARMLTLLDRDLRRRGVRLVVADQIGQVRDLIDVADGAQAPFESAPSVAEAVARLTEGGTGASADRAPAPEGHAPTPDRVPEPGGPTVPVV